MAGGAPNNEIVDGVTAVDIPKDALCEWCVKATVGVVSRVGAPILVRSSVKSATVKPLAASVPIALCTACM